MPGVRSSVAVQFRVGRDNALTQLLADQSLTAVVDTLIHQQAGEYVIGAGEQNVLIPFGDVVDGRIFFIIADGDLSITFGGVAGTPAVLTSAAGTYNTGFAVDTPFAFLADGVAVPVTFTSADQTRAQVIQRINSAAILAGLTYLPASAYLTTQIRITGLDATLEGEVEITTALAQIGFASVGALANGTNPRADGAPMSLRRPATAGSTSAISMKSYLIGSLQAGSLVVSNLSADTAVRAYIGVVGDIDPSPGVC